jgi:hypothetical protein
MAAEPRGKEETMRHRTGTVPHGLILAAVLAASGACRSAGDPPPDAETAVARRTGGRSLLQNGRIGVSWSDAGAVRDLRIAAPQLPPVPLRERFCIILDDGKEIPASRLAPLEAARLEHVQGRPDATRAEDRSGGWTLRQSFRSQEPPFRADWSMTLRDGSGYVVFELRLAGAGRDVPVRRVRLIDAGCAGAKVLGIVQGSPVVAGRMFFGCESPLAENGAEGDRVRCEVALPPLRAGGTRVRTAAVGVVPAGQLRRGFLRYLERRRARPYRPFLHYNSWYHLNIGRPGNRMVEAECLETVARIGRELTEKRGVRLDGFVWDDGWDDHDSLWDFHDGFPRGFLAIRDAAAKHGAALGVWLSPWGGYGAPHRRRVAYGKQQGFETNARGFSMAGPKYRARFREVCLRMMRDQGAVFFKFDGMGGGNVVSGAKAEGSEDIEGVLELVRALREENPALFVSATTGTWASPYWLLHADSIWRQGGDTGYHGAGNHREQWITYRDMYVRRRVVQAGPLYPLNALMFHGLTIGERRNPAKMPRDEASVAHEIWTIFGCGTALLELYISPHLLTDRMWDEVAAAATWYRANADVLVDTHWVGGDPGKGQVYGFASWSPRKGVLVLRNPSDKNQTIDLDIGRAFELPAGAPRAYRLRDARNPGAGDAPLRMEAGRARAIELEPFDVRVWDALPE